MKKLLAAINSKYIHTNPAVRSLRAYCRDLETEIAEFSVNERTEDILRKIYEYRAGAVCFSCYIWNIECVMKISRCLKAVAPDTVIVFGGPEVSYDAPEYLNSGYVDAVIRGEGEQTFRELCENGFSFRDTAGVSYIENGRISENPDRTPIDMETLPFPYTDDELREQRRMFYYETSRGCPYRCSYCISSLEKTLRFKSTEKVCRELMLFIKNGVKLVKLTDRTFNADAARAKRIVRFLSENGGNTSFHFEIAAHTLDDELIQLFCDAPEGRFQLEIGVQSTNVKTLEAINRVTDFSRISEAVRTMRRGGNVKLHLDLIAGLPYENMESFRRSFNDVYALAPHELQLGFLKLLKGTAIRDTAERYGYVYDSSPVYEVLGSRDISYEELTELKGVEDMLDKYYNSGVFEYSIKYLENISYSYYGLYLSLYEYFRSRGVYGQSLSRDTLYVMLHDYGVSINAGGLFWDSLKFDYLLNNRAARLPYGGELIDREFFERRFEFIDSNRDTYFSGFGDMTAKEIAKRVTFAGLEYNVPCGGERENITAMFFRDGGWRIARREE